MPRYCALLLLLSSYPRPETLSREGRYLAQVSTDKPIYRVGENVYTRVVVLDAHNHTPLLQPVYANVRVVGPKGDVVATGGANAQDGVIGFSWPVTEGLAGGEYTLAFTFSNGMAPAERKIDLRIFRAPRLKSQIELSREGFGPGDTVQAKLHTERAEGGIPKGAKVSVSARVDDREVYSGISMVDGNGDARAQFALPSDIERGEGTLAMIIEDGGVVETATKTLPILVKTVDVRLFAEGGELLANVPNRLYVEARTPAKKPADIEAVLVDGADKEVARLKTEHEGRGRVTFTPQPNQSYSLRIVAPAGIKRTFPLAPVRSTGALLQAVSDVIPAKASAEFKFASNSPGDFKLTLSQRGVEVASKNVSVGSGGWFSFGASPGKLNDVSVPLRDEIDGVLVATLWEGETPLSERLVFRQAQNPLQVSITADPDTLVPGARAKVEVRTTDRKGDPIGAIVGVSVTDESVLEMIETREQAARLPAMYFLEPEVSELADAHVYLDARNPKAPLALDLLLATQGWRRFALKDINAFIAQHGDAARRAFAVMPPVRKPEPRPKAEEGWGVGGGNAMPAQAVPAAPMPKAAAAPPPSPPGGVVRPALANEPPRKALPPAADLKPVVNKEEKKRVVAQGVLGGGAAGPRGGALLVAADEEPRGDFADEINARQPQGPGALVWVREYVHTARPGRQPDERIDFTETLYWSAAIATDAKTGRATFYFDTSDAVTAFRISADAFSKTGALGEGRALLKSVKPFYLEPKMPLQLTSGDVVKLPLALVNGTKNRLQLSLSADAAKGLKLTLPAQATGVEAAGRQRLLLPLDTAGYVGKSELTITGSGDGAMDKVTRPLDVRPAGFPMTISHGGLLEGTAQLELDVPASVVPGSLTTDIAVYPTPLANLTQALTRLMQEPYGCFEQTSSTSYPLTMAQQYFTSHSGVDPAIVKRSQELLTAGYRRLTSFECKDKGYEWFGGTSPGHEALTAYGLMQFADMKRAKLAMVDPGMQDRTRAWLLSRRDGKGGFSRNQRALDSFGGAPPATTNAYIAWALAEAGEPGIDAEARAVTSLASTSRDAYVVGLGANIAALRKDGSAKTLLDKLAAAQGKDGSLSGQATITQSGGEALRIETTAIAALAWMKDSRYTQNLDRAMRYLASACEGGRFGSTQATVLALKAIVAYDALRARAQAPGTLQLIVDGKLVGAAVPFSAKNEGAIVVPPLTSLSAGKHMVQLKMTGGGVMPYSFALQYNALTPASAAATRVNLTTTLRDSTIEEGKVTEIRVEVTNTTDAMVPTPVAIIGVPGGLEVRHDQLKELTKAGTIATYEVLGREVVLYWRALQPKQTVTLPISVVAAVPGHYTAPASRAYEYYTDENKRWVDGTTVDVTPRN